MSADLYPPNDIDSGWTFGQLEAYANQLYARALAAETECASLVHGQVKLADRIVAIEAERDQARKAKSGTAGDPEMYLLAVEEGQKALDLAHAAEARVKACGEALREADELLTALEQDDVRLYGCACGPIIGPCFLHGTSIPEFRARHADALAGLPEENE